MPKIGKIILADAILQTQLTRKHNRRVKLKRFIETLKKGMTPWKR